LACLPSSCRICQYACKQHVEMSMHGLGCMQGPRQESVREHPATHHPVYIGVMRHVGEMFDEIRTSVTHYGISNCLRAALLQPLHSPSLKQVRSDSLGQSPIIRLRQRLRNVSCQLRQLRKRRWNYRRWKDCSFVIEQGRSMIRVN
jgi:hypothetical protein